MRRILTALCIIATIAFATIAMASTTIDQAKIRIPGETKVTATTLTTSVFKDDTGAPTSKEIASLQLTAMDGMGQAAGTAIIALAPVAGSAQTTLTVLTMDSLALAGGNRKTLMATALGVLALTDIAVGSQNSSLASNDTAAVITAEVISFAAPALT